MSQAENLLNSISTENISTFTVDPVTESHIVVGDDRFIIVPKELQRIAVQYDHNMETVTFDCPRYWDGHDMSTMRVYINYMRSDRYKDSYLAQKVTAEGDIMHFDWTISRNVTEVKGPLVFLVCVKKADDDNNEVNHWNSELNTQTYISEGLECASDESILMEYPDYLASLEQEYRNSFDELKAELMAAAASGEFNGKDGDPGFSPVVTVTKRTNGYLVEITDATNTDSFYLEHGKNGADGTDGTDGVDGVSPTISTQAISGGNRVTITDVNGTKSFDVMDGTTEISEAVTDYMNNFVYIGGVEPASGPTIWFDTSATAT